MVVEVKQHLKKKWSFISQLDLSLLNTCNYFFFRMRVSKIYKNGPTRFGFTLQDAVVNRDGRNQEVDHGYREPRYSGNFIWFVIWSHLSILQGKVKLATKYAFPCFLICCACKLPTLVRFHNSFEALSFWNRIIIIYCAPAWHSNSNWIGSCW